MFNLKMVFLAYAQFTLNNGATAVGAQSAGVLATSFVRNGAGDYTFSLDTDNPMPASDAAAEVTYYPGAAEVVIARIQGTNGTPGQFRLFFTDPATGALTEVTGKACVSIKRRAAF